MKVFRRLLVLSGALFGGMLGSMAGGIALRIFGSQSPMDAGSALFGSFALAFAAGVIDIDEGAMRAVRNHKSLLPSGIVSVEGTFEAGEVVMLNNNAKAVTSLSSSQLKTLAGKHSSEIKKLLGPGHRDVVAIPEDIIFLDY
jgi:glutamate 5-kinase